MKPILLADDTPEHADHTTMSLKRGGLLTGSCRGTRRSE